MKIWHGAVAALSVVAMTACGGGHEDMAAVELAPVRARVAAAETTTVPQRLELFGTVAANRTAAVSSRVMATVTAVPVNAGEVVREGQVLVEIDPETARAQEAQARGGQAQAEAALTLAKRNYERFKALAEKGAASELELDMARMQYEQAQGAVEQGKGVVTAAASVARESTVKAPFAGRVVAKMVEVGDLAAPGRPLVMVESASGRRLVVSVPESAASRIDIGAQVPVSVDAMPELGTIEGRVVEMTPGADPASHTFTVKVDLGGVEVPSGLAGRAWLPLGDRQVVSVPRGAVISRGGIDMVVVEDGSGKARSRAVSLGDVIGDDRVEVLAGLTGDERVLVGLSQAPPDGSPVEEVQS